MVDSDLHDDARRNGVSRRRFVQAAGASGVALGLAGCIGGNPNDGGSGGNTSPINTEAPSGDVKIQWAADSRVAENSDRIMEALRNAGLPDNINLEILAGSQVTDNRQSQYQTWLNSGREEPALLMMDSGWTIPFIVRDQIQNLSQSLPNDWIKQVENNYFQASVDTAKHPDSGDLFGIPLFPDFPTIQYRKDLVTQAGYDPEGQNWATESMSWKDFSAMIKDTMEQTNTQQGFNFQASVYEGLSCCDFNEFMSSFGGAYFGGLDNLFGPVGDRPITVDEDPVVQSIRMVRTFIHGSDDQHALDGYAGNISPEAVLQWVEDSSKAPFDNGNAVALRNWPYSIVENGAEENYGEDLGVMPIPWGVKPDQAKYEGTGGPVAALGGWHMTINPNASDDAKSAAANVIKAMMTEDFKLKIFEIMGWIPPEPKLLNSQRAKKVPVIGRYLEPLRVAGENAIPRPVTAVWTQQSGKIAQQVNAAYAQKKAPKQAMTELKSQLQDIENNA
ncbi:substrate-binding domain-containing protein [Halegenticoccus soli]|uniref:substrate-binding domain-containing protein n=1 Tax=Halegenticoccus soli TaxID=1985678 RepID=UPI000C6EFC75|nr:substrate-binding domain-containing protein [Halegenticoccus soli]